MDTQIKPAFQSSIDPTKLSLTVESGSKAIIGAITTLVALKGLDATPIATQAQGLVDSIITLISAGFTTWHIMQTIYGLIRKAFVVKA